MSLHSIMVVRFLPHTWVNYFHILWRHWCVSKTSYGQHETLYNVARGGHDEVSNFFNILFKNKILYKLVVIFYLFVFQESIGERGLVDPSTNYG